MTSDIKLPCRQAIIVYRDGTVTTCADGTAAMALLDRYTTWDSCGFPGRTYFWLNANDRQRAIGSRAVADVCVVEIPDDLWGDA